MRPGAIFILIATAPSLIALAIGLVPGIHHGPAIVVGGACGWALALIGALLVAWPPASLRLAAIAAAAAFSVRIGGAGAIALGLLATGAEDASTTLATIAIGIGGALTVEMVWWFRTLRREITTESAAVEAALGDAHHA